MAPEILVAHTRDDLHAVRLIEELEFRHAVDVTTLDIGIRDGKARVRGIVSDQDELDAVEETIGEGGGITQLEYLVKIAPTRREEDRDRARLLQELLDGEPDLASQNIQVACLGKQVVLRGTVGSALHKAKAGLLLVRQGDVPRLRNRLVVLTEE